MPRSVVNHEFNPYYAFSLHNSSSYEQQQEGNGRFVTLLLAVYYQYRAYRVRTGHTGFKMSIQIQVRVCVLSSHLAVLHVLPMCISI